LNENGNKDETSGKIYWRLALTAFLGSANPLAAQETGTTVTKEVDRESDADDDSDDEWGLLGLLGLLGLWVCWD
jgi:MYXO-CTERM domain-containing protein